MSDDTDEEIELSISGPADVEIDLSDDNSTDSNTTDDDQDSIDLSRPATIESPSLGPQSPNRGTFVFPAHDPGFMQRLEIRGNNGAQKDVETVYLLTGDSYQTPTELVQLDDSDVYNEMTRSSVSTKLSKIAEKLDRLYQGRPDPQLIAYVHTHPSGSTRPSRVDRIGSDTAKEVFGRHFDDFEFFNIIHGLGDKTDVPVEKMREPHTSNGGVWWYGETRRHELAVFDKDYNSRTVVLP